MQVVCCQFDLAWEDRETNFAAARSMLSARPPAPGALVVLPEMFSTGFSMNVSAIAEGAERPTERFLSEIARSFNVFVLGGLVTVGDDGKGRNECFVCGPDGAPVARYQKIHPFTFSRESEHYTGGTQVVTFPWGGLTVAPLICYDLRFPEAFRHAVKRGAHLYTVISNWPAARQEHWLALLKARAIENQAYIVGVNRIGTDPGNTYTGGSQIISPRGDVLADGGSAAGLVTAEVDLDMVSDERKRFPALADIRLI